MGVTIAVKRLTPAEAELIVLDSPQATGRFVGPRSCYASTIEVPYPLRPFPDGIARTIIPDPSFWDPETPLLYEARIVSDGRETRQFVGLRTTSLLPNGLRVNGRPFRLDAVRRTSLADATALRAMGVNAVIVPVRPETRVLWSEADRAGLFVIGEVERDANAVALACELGEHVSALAWTVDAPDLLDEILLRPKNGVRPILGVRSRGEIPPWAQFLVGDAINDPRPRLGAGGSLGEFRDERSF